MATHTQNRGCFAIIALVIVIVGVSWMMRGMHWLLVWVDRALSGVVPADPVYSWAVFGAIIGLVLYVGMHGAKARRATLRPTIAALVTLGLLVGGRFVPHAIYSVERTWVTMRSKSVVQSPGSADSNSDQPLANGTLAAKRAASAALPTTPSPVQGPERPQPVPVTAKSVLERYVRESGGRQAREAVKSLETRANATGMWGKDHVVFTAQNQYPDREIYRCETTTSKLIYERGIVGDVAWERSAANGLRLLTRKELEQAKWVLRADEVLLNPSGFYTTMTVEGTNVDVERVSTTKLVLDGPMGRSTHYYSNNNGLLVRTEEIAATANGEAQTIIDLGAYRAVAGVLVPHTLRMSTNNMKVTFEYVEMKPNVTFPADTFRIPDDVKALLGLEMLDPETHRLLETICENLCDQLAMLKEGRIKCRTLIERGLANADSADPSDRNFVQYVKEVLASSVRDEQAIFSTISHIFEKLWSQPPTVRNLAIAVLPSVRKADTENIRAMASGLLNSAMSLQAAPSAREVEIRVNALIPSIEVPAKLKP